MSTDDTKLDALQQGLRVLGDEALIALALDTISKQRRARMRSVEGGE